MNRSSYSDSDVQRTSSEPRRFLVESPDLPNSPIPIILVLEIKSSTFLDYFSICILLNGAFDGCPTHATGSLGSTGSLADLNLLKVRLEDRGGLTTKEPRHQLQRDTRGRSRENDDCILRWPRVRVGRCTC